MRIAPSGRGTGGMRRSPGSGSQPRSTSSGAPRDRAEHAIGAHAGAAVVRLVVEQHRRRAAKRPLPAPSRSRALRGGIAAVDSGSAGVAAATRVGGVSIACFSCMRASCQKPSRANTAMHQQRQHPAESSGCGGRSPRAPLRLR